MEILIEEINLIGLKHQRLESYVKDINGCFEEINKALVD